MKKFEEVLITFLSSVPEPVFMGSIRNPWFVYVFVPFWVNFKIDPNGDKSISPICARKGFNDGINWAQLIQYVTNLGLN